MKENAYYFYYKVNSADIGLENQVIYDLQLDSLQTIYFNDDLKIEGSFIQKAHLDRWVEVDSSTIEFNGKVDGSLFEREELKNVAKRLVERKKLRYSTDLKYCYIINPKINSLIKEINHFFIYLITIF